MTFHTDTEDILKLQKEVKKIRRDMKDIHDSIKKLSKYIKDVIEELSGIKNCIHESCDCSNKSQMKESFGF